MNTCYVKEILKPPEEQSIRLGDDFIVKVWSVSVKMQHEDYIFNSFVTFESLEEAINLKIGAEFLR